MKLNYSGDELRTPRRHQLTWTHLCRDSVVLCRVSGERVELWMTVAESYRVVKFGYSALWCFSCIMAGNAGEFDDVHQYLSTNQYPSRFSKNAYKQVHVF